MPETRRGADVDDASVPADGQRGAPPRPLIFASAAKGAEDFTGRDWVVEQILDWIDHGSERFCLLIGEPGWGKSSLSAWMIGPGREPRSGAAKARLSRIRNSWSAAYLCSAVTGSTIDPTTFVRSMAAQLAYRFDDFASAFLQRAAPGQYNVNISANAIVGRAIGILTKQIIVEAADARDVYEQSVRQPLADVAVAKPGGDPVFILVDGLDDALTFTSPNIVDLLERSTDFPDRVRFFLTSRREERVLNAFPASAGVRIIAVSTEANQADNDKDIRDYVAARASEPNVAAWAARTGREPDAFVDDLVAQAAGNFLYIRFVLDNPPPPGTAGAAVPTGLEAAYDEFLARVLPGVGRYGTDPTWTETVKPVLGALTVAVPAAPEDAMPRWLGPTHDVTEALATVGQMTEWVDDDGGSRRLYHRSLGDFLSTETLPPRAGEPQPNRFFVHLRDYHETIATYYLGAIERDWDRDWRKCDRYGLRRLVPHLYALHAMTEGRAERSKIADQLCDLALDPDFEAAQRQVLGDGSATIEAIRLALEVCTEAGDPATIRKRVRRVAASWEPEMRASAARAIAELSRTDQKAAVDELKGLLR